MPRLTSSPRGRGFQLLRRLEQELRFAVHRPGYPVAFPRSHGVPRRDIPGRVYISVERETAGSAPEDGLTLARLPVHLPARRATLARVMRVDLFHPAGRLLFQTTDQQAPARPQDLSIERGLGADVPAWVSDRSPGRPRHISDLQILDSYQVKPARDVRTDLLRPVFPPVCLAGLKPRNSQPYPPATVRAASRTAELPLQPPHAPPRSHRQAGNVQHLSCGQCSTDGNAPVDAYSFAVTRLRNRLRNRSECYMPASGPVHRDPIGLHAGRHRPGPAEPNPPRLRYPHLANVTGDTAHVPLPSAPPHNAEPFVPASLPPRRPGGRILCPEEGGHRLSEIPQRLLLHHLRAFSQPRVLRTSGSELPTLLQVARRVLPARAPVRVLLDREVPHVPGVSAMLPQYCLLGRKGN
jgi:hypothetical protein